MLTEKSAPAEFSGSSTQISGGEAHHFTTGEYRIVKIEIENGRNELFVLYRLDNGPTTSKAATLDFKASFVLRVQYECLLPNLPEFSCGIAVDFTYADTMEKAMYFNTNYPHSDDEVRNYFSAEFRKYRGRTGIIEGRIPNLQTRPGSYLLTLALLPNQPGPHEFYEFHKMLYSIHVRGDGHEFPAMFYPRVRFSHKSLADDAATDTVNAGMISAGRNALPENLRSESSLDDEALKNVYLAMKKAAE